MLSFLSTHGLELVAVLFTLASVVTGMRRHVATWSTGIAGVVAYAALFWRERLYADFGLQAVFLAQSAFGLWAWTRRPAQAAPATVSARWATARVRALSLAVAACTIPVVALWLGAHTRAALPWADATLATISLVANTLLALRYVENWLGWVAADVGYTVLFWQKALPFSAALYALLVVLALLGLRDWTRAARRPAAHP